jgi:hypothetical protein
MIVTEVHITVWRLLTKSTITKIYLLNLWKGRLYLGGGGGEVEERVGGKGKKLLHYVVKLHKTNPPLPD